MNTKIFAAILVTCVLCLLPNCAGGHALGFAENRQGSFSVELLADGRPLPVYRHHRGGAIVEGIRGQRYVVRVHNRSWRRVEAVIAVDGRDVIDGASADLSKRGYIIPPHSSVDIDGFRLNMADVAAFRFSSVADSYAARMGTPWGVGMISVAIFPERRRYWPRPRPPYRLGQRKSGRIHSEDQAAESMAPYGSGSSRNLGTEFGERRASPVSETRFIRLHPSRPAARLALRYDDRAGLCTIGLCPTPPPYWPQPPYRPRPEPPPQFAEPPPGWNHFGTWY